eukprot:CAMPEP_0113507324 /NCGR_PEP_ID=MMETSP0014_2-20120614/36401_1 /TAXON_ID=2857 /ORGANISM="Nitzschia sp." /LENGTH=433 /DNA_ID=CAMNT_0000402919 /DNA_START=268 /DNA_END=1569 /DNA_ORIENTATION=- /assembly_acc=CAM_ASM_000159
MKIYFSISLLVASSLSSSMRFMADAFVVPNARSAPTSSASTMTTTTLSMSSPPPGGADEFYNMASEQMKNLKPEDIDKMLEEIDTMNPIQKAGLKAMGMDPEMMKKSMEMMKKNPAMIESAKRMMSNMTPEQIMERSKEAQEQMAKMSPDDLEKAQQTMESLPEDALKKAAEQMETAVATAAAASTAVDVDAEDADTEMYTGPGSSSDPAVIDAMYRVGEMMSEPINEGGVTLVGFASVPPIQLLSGDREFDLSPSELRECWSEGAQNAFRVDRAGFERVWKEVQEYFEDDLMSEARKEAKKKAKGPKKVRGSEKVSVTPTNQVGSTMKEEDVKAMNESVKNMSEGDMSNVLDAMNNMDSAAEERMKSMGVDPAMMRQTAEMMKKNPEMMKAAKEMMANMSPDDMLKASRDAQEQMAKMTPEQREQMLKNMPQ